MANVVSEGATTRRTRSLRAELALRTVAATTVPGDRPRRVLEQALVFTSAAFAGVYTRAETGDVLCLSESVGVPRTLYGLRDAYPLAGRSPMADAHRAGRALWLVPEEVADCSDARRMPECDAFMAVLPLPGNGRGCLLVVTESPGGFDSEDRECLELVAEAVACPAPDEAAQGEELPPNAFSLAMDTGRVEVGDDLLALFGIGRADFDGRVETLLALTVPEDLPALMSVVEADHMTIGERELEFRVLQPDGP
ncbi:GAF domain-containing protein, partial [Streptomyces spiralis]